MLPSTGAEDVPHQFPNWGGPSGRAQHPAAVGQDQAVPRAGGTTWGEEGWCLGICGAGEGISWMARGAQVCVVTHTAKSCFCRAKSVSKREDPAGTVPRDGLCLPVPLRHPVAPVQRGKAAPWGEQHPVLCWSQQ